MMRRLRERKNDEQGFTLLELLVALSILAAILGPLAMAFYSSVSTTRQLENDVSRTTDAQRLMSYFNRDVQSVDRDGVNANPACGDQDDGTTLVNLAWDLDSDVVRQATYQITGYGKNSKLVRRVCDDDGGAVTENVVMSAFGVDGKDALEMVHGPSASDPLDVCGAVSCTIAVDGDYSFSHTATRRVQGPSGATILSPPPAPPKPEATGRYLYAATWWEAPPLEAGQPEILGYRAYIFEEGSSTPSSHLSAGPDIRTWRVEPLPLGGRYYFRVQAYNVVGSGPLSPRSDVVEVQPSVPDKPTGVQVTEGDQRLDVSWQPPANTGGLDLQGYRVSATKVSDGSIVTSDVVAGTSTSLTGLQNGTEYVVVVVAINGKGQGDPSDDLPPFVPYGLAIPPGSVNSKAAENAVQLRWTRTADDGNGRPVNGYVVRLYAGADPGTLEFEDTFNLTAVACAGDDTTCEVSVAATNGTQYRGTVAPRVAITESQNGPGAESVKSEPIPADAKVALYVRPSLAPSTAAAPTSSKSGTTVTVSGTVPSGNGEPIDKVQVQYDRRPANSPTWQLDVVASPPANASPATGSYSVQLLNMPTGYEYRFRVRFGNQPDWNKTVDRFGSWSSSSTSVTIPGPPATPAAPTAVVAGTTKTASVSWTAPADNGSAIFCYEIQPNVGPTRAFGATADSATCAGSGSASIALTQSMTGLTNGTATTFQVRARNAEGYSGWSSASAAVVPYGSCTLNPTQDTWISERNKGDRHGGDGDLRSQNQYQLFGTNDRTRVGLKFDVSAGGCTGLAASSSVQSSKLELYNIENHNRDLELRPISAAWVENTNWTDSGGFGVTGVATTATTSGSGRWFTFTSANLSTNVQAMLATPAGNYGWRIEQTQGTSTFDGSLVRFSSREASTNKPTLTFTYW